MSGLLVFAETYYAGFVGEDDYLDAVAQPEFGKDPGDVSQHLNKTTCLLTQTLAVTYTISHGTGTYTGISGSGHGTLTDLEITARNSHGACSTTTTPRAQQVIAHGQGPVTLP